MAIVSQRTFSGGEVAPSLYARSDQNKYRAGLRTCRNFLVMRHGGVQNRPGTGFVGEVKDSTAQVKLHKFVFNSTQTYVLEFGNLYMRVIRSGAQVTEAAQDITGITNANPAVLTYSGADNYANGDEVYISGVVGNIANYVNGRNFKVVNLNAGANTFELDYLDDSNVNSTSWGTYTSGGTIAEVYTITTPYVTADLQDLQIAQSADVLTIVHPNYAPRTLTRTGHAAWTLAAITFEPAISRPTAVTGTAGGAGAVQFRYKVTAVDAETREESLCGKGAQTNSITGITRANPAVVTYSGTDNYTNGDTVLIEGVAGMTEVNGKEFEVANVNTGANTFELRGINSTAYTAYSSAGTAYVVSTSFVGAALSSSNSNTITWTLVSGAGEYNVYRDLNGIYGFIGVAGSSSFVDTNITPDTEETPPGPRNVFAATGDYPSAVSFYQQRRMLANSDNDPETVWGSRSGLFTNFSLSSPIQADDSPTFKMAGRQVNEVRHLVELAKLVVLTSGGEWTINGDSAGTLTPAEVNPQQHSYNGANTMSPIIINGSALYVQARGSIVRDIGFDYEIDGYRGNDLTIFAAHLFDGYTLRDWDFQQIPHSVVWAVRSDGTLLGLTYIREHQIVAWHRHDFDGTVEQVCCVPEGTEDAVYLVIKRTINGATKRYIERMKTRAISAIEDSVFVDCSLTYDGENTGATTMTLSGGTNWTFDEVLTLTASAAYFASTDVDNEIRIDSATGATIRCRITAFTSTTVVSVVPHMTVPANLQSTARATWRKAVKTVTGLWHLEAETVSALGDGFVAANPNNGAYTTVTVANGTATFDQPYAVLHAGLPYTSDLQTLDIEPASEETLANQKKLISQVTLFVESSRGIWVGSQEPTSDTDFDDQLTELKQRETETHDEPVDLATRSFTMNVRGTYSRGGRVFIRQTDPLPLAVLSVAPAGVIPGAGG